MIRRIEKSKYAVIYTYGGKVEINLIDEPECTWCGKKCIENATVEIFDTRIEISGMEMKFVDNENFEYKHARRIDPIYYSKKGWWFYHWYELNFPIVPYKETRPYGLITNGQYIINDRRCKTNEQILS